jgi:hypothetical protein
MKAKEFTASQMRHWKDYEKVRASGRFNMFDPRARLECFLTEQQYDFVMDNYTALKQCVQSHEEAPNTP